MCTSDGIVKILDFGLAKRTDGATPSGVDSLGTDPTATGLVMGMAAYMSPEQARGQRADERSDLFAFGVVLYELLSGVHPFRRATLADTVSAVLRDTPPAIGQVRSGIPPAFAALVTRLLEKDPAARPASAREVER
jgi:serine/threonine protein kinase